MCCVPGAPALPLVHFPREPRASGFLRNRLGIRLVRTRRTLDRGADALTSLDDVAAGRLAFDPSPAAIESWLGASVTMVRRRGAIHSNPAEAR